jgi:lysophospholipase L1-like esterase
MGVVRKIKPTSGLVRYDAKNDALDWSQAIKDVLAGEKPNAIIVMLGLNDRLPLKDRVPPKPAPPKSGEAQPPGAQGQTAGQAPSQTPGQAPAAQTQGQAQTQTAAPGAAQAPQNPPQPAAAADTEGGAQAPSAQAAPSGSSFDFHTDKWAEIYGKRIDEMINALKAKGVPILWVGVPAIRGTKSTSDMAYLDEIYRERAEKAGIAYVDIWDGFVDDQGRYTVQGPDFEGQTRKLRTPDGVYFTKAGAVKLASYADQELRRIISNRATPVALPGPDAIPKPAVAVGTHPDVGPVVPLAASGGESGSNLLGGDRPAQLTSTDPVAAKVLTRGDAIAAPAGRADDFTWPRRGPDANATADTGPLPGPDQPAPAPGPKKGADTKKQPDTKAADSKTKPAPDQGAAKPRRAPSASLDGAPRPPRDVGGGGF